MMHIIYGFTAYPDICESKIYLLKANPFFKVKPVSNLLPGCRPGTRAKS